MLNYCSVSVKDFEDSNFPKNKLDLKSCDTFYFVKNNNGTYEQLVSCASQDKSRITKMIDAIVDKQLHSFSVAFEFGKDKTTCYQLYINDKIYKEIINLKDNGANCHQILLNILNKYSKDYKQMINKSGVVIRKTNSYYLVPTNSTSKTVSIFCSII